MHYTAGLRYLLGPEIFVTRLSAFTTLLQEHLPPTDTVDAILKTNTGIQGTFQVSYGTSLVGPEWTIGCENGSVSVEDSKITVRSVDGKEDIQNVEDERTGVPPEVRQWGQALAAGKVNPEQSPSQALADLELVSDLLETFSVLIL